MGPGYSQRYQRYTVSQRSKLKSPKTQKLKNSNDQKFGQILKNKDIIFLLKRSNYYFLNEKL